MENPASLPQPQEKLSPQIVKTSELPYPTQGLKMTDSCLRMPSEGYQLSNA